MSEQKRTASSARYLAMVACILIGGFVYVGWRMKKGDELQQQLLLTADVKEAQARQQDLNLEIPQKADTDTYNNNLNQPVDLANDEFNSITIGGDTTTDSYEKENDLDIDSLLASIPDSKDAEKPAKEVIGGVMSEIRPDINMTESEQIPPNRELPPAINTINTAAEPAKATEEYQESPQTLPTISERENRNDIEKNQEDKDPLDAFSTTTYEIYKVRRGDTLSKIALKLLGSRKKAKDIFNANRSIMSSPHHLRVGMNLRIPVVINPKRTSIHVISTTDSLPSIAMRYYGSADPEMIEGIRLANPILSQGGFREGIKLKIPPAAVARQTPVDFLAHTPAGVEKIYIVRPGDTLSKIAARKYGNGNKWRHIFNANKDKISKPSALRVGMKLRLP